MRLTACTALLLLAACSEDEPTDTNPPAPTFDCAPGTRTGPEGETDGERSAESIIYSLRTPPGYDPTEAYPLIVVYAPAGADEEFTEQFTGLSGNAKVNDYVIAYADHVSPQSTDAVAPLGALAAEITERWCIDTERVYLTGHSDGGTASHVIALFDQMGFAPAGIAPSAAGISRSLLDGQDCPAELIPTMVMHSWDDALFPLAQGFGKRAADWWALCNGCDPQPGLADDDGCQQYANCDAETLYCEHDGSHGSWPRKNERMIEFFGRN